MRSYSFLCLASLFFVLACDDETTEPRRTSGQKQLQSVELHYPWEQIVFDSMFYTEALLTRQKRQSTGWTDLYNYTFEYNPKEITVSLEQNGIPPVDFLRKDILNDDGQLAQIVIKKDDGTLFATYDYVYNTLGTLVAQHITQEGVQHTDSVKLDANGNQLALERVNHKRKLVTTYDENPNPFYQSPIITGTFVNHSPNNLTRFQVFLGDTLYYEKIYQYQYGADDYPKQVVVQGSWRQDPEETYYFYYKE